MRERGSRPDARCADEMERKEALFIIFVAHVSFSGPRESEWSAHKGTGGARSEAAERSPMDVRALRGRQELPVPRIRM